MHYSAPNFWTLYLSHFFECFEQSIKIWVCQVELYNPLWTPKATKLCSRILSSKCLHCQIKQLLLQTKHYFQTPYLLHFLSISSSSSWWWVYQVEVHNTFLNSKDNQAMSNDFKFSTISYLNCSNINLSTLP